MATVSRFFRDKLRGLSWRLKRAAHGLSHGKQLVLVYSMGKVGSSTVIDLFRKQYPYLHVFQVHFLSDNWLKKKLPALDPVFHENIAIGEKILAHIAQHPDQRLKIITLVREPMARDISDIFQNWKGLFGVSNVHELTVDHLTKWFDNNPHEYTLNWFDTEFREWLGFDIYSVPFDKEQGYSIYMLEKADVLCLKLEKIDSCFAEAMKTFTGMDFTLGASANRTEMKAGKELYKALMTGYKAPEAKLKSVYGSKYVTHFYTAEEIERFTKKWSRGEATLKDIAEGS